MSERDNYYRRRISDELMAAGRADCPKAAAAHRELAEIYRILVDGEDASKAPLVGSK